MSLQSMTGYGQGLAMAVHPETAIGWQAEVELKSVNGRFLKLNVRTNPQRPGFEKTLETALQGRISRGSLSATLCLSREDQAQVQLDVSVVRAYQAQFRRLGLDESSLPSMPGVLMRAEETPTSSDFHEHLISQALDTAVNELHLMRMHEGEALYAVLMRLIGQVEMVVTKIAARAPEVVPAYAVRLHERIQKLLSSDINIEQADLAREVALMADRVDVTEEIDRLRAHIGHMRKLFSEEDVVGRRIEFLTQELHREANTLGSKNIDAHIAQWVIDLKVEIEKIKEQVANIE